MQLISSRVFATSTVTIGYVPVPAYLQALVAPAAMKPVLPVPSPASESAASRAAASQASALTSAMASALEKHSGLKIQMYAAPDYDDLVEKMSEKKIDFAFLSSLALVEAEQKGGAKVLLKKVWTQGFYHSVFLVKKSSAIHKVQDLKGHRIAFVDEKSISGYIYPELYLKELGLDFAKDFKSIVFSGSHANSVGLLAKGDVDAIAVFSNDPHAVESAWTHEKGHRASDVRMLWSSAAIPNDPFCVRQAFYDRSPKIAHDIMFGLIEMSEDPTTGAELKQWLGARGLMIASSLQYEPVRELVRSAAARAAKIKDKTP